jgi:hypothetical protein
MVDYLVEKPSFSSPIGRMHEVPIRGDWKRMNVWLRDGRLASICEKDFRGLESMLDTLEQVAKHCGIQLEIYGQCIDKNPGTWDSACLQQRRALTKCAEQKYILDMWMKWVV